jgi:hypothetical protein
MAWAIYQIGVYEGPQISTLPNFSLRETVDYTLMLIAKLMVGLQAYSVEVLNSPTELKIESH